MAITQSKHFLPNTTSSGVPVNRLSSVPSTSTADNTVSGSVMPASTSELGDVLLSTAALFSDAPVVVADNDSRVSGGGGFGSITLPDQALIGTLDGTNTIFVLPATPTVGFAVYRDGLRCRQGISGTLGYSYNSSTLQVTFNAAPKQFAVADIS